MQSLPYQVFLTRNSEYHVQSHVCVGVRDRRTGRWFEQHPALFRPLATSVSTAGQLALIQAPQLGESLEFDLGDKDRKPLRTSPVMNIEVRPRSAGPEDLPFPRSPSAKSSITSRTKLNKSAIKPPRKMRWARWAAAARRRAGLAGRVSAQNTP